MYIYDPWTYIYRCELSGEGIAGGNGKPGRGREKGEKNVTTVIA